MSITYLQDPNGYLEIANIWWVGQTVTLDVTTRTYNLYFESWRGTDRNDILCDVYLTDGNHHPVGSPLASAKEFLQVWEKDQRRDRDCFVFRDLTMEAGVEYFFLIYDKSPTWHVNTRIYARKGDSIFEDGMLYYSDDAGETWTEYPNDDIIFALTGIPEIPPQPPDPPIKNFAILDLQQEVTSTGIKITVTTNVPCHLYCYWTATEPEKHLIPILTRGIEMHTRLKMCFVNWHENEQEEPFDTLTHTFTKEPWAHCETRWLTFRAKVMNEWVKSVGPIFKKHRVEPEEETVTIPAAEFSADYFYEDPVWATAREDPNCEGIRANLPEYKLASYTLRFPTRYIIDRGVLRFDTSSIPEGATVLSATLKLCFWTRVSSAGAATVHISSAVGCGDATDPADYGHVLLNTDNVITPLVADVIPLQSLESYTINELGVINCGGQTRLGMITKFDRFNIQPSGSYKLWITWVGEIDRFPGVDTHARLEVTYSP